MAEKYLDPPSMKKEYLIILLPNTLLVIYHLGVCTAKQGKFDLHIVTVTRCAERFKLFCVDPLLEL